MTQPLREIQIRDEFDHERGEFVDYDALNETQRDALQTQQHIDIRSFVPPTIIRPTMLHLDLIIASQLNFGGDFESTMGDLETPTVSADPGEGWTAGDVARQIDRNYSFGIQFDCTVAGNADPTDGFNYTESILRA